MGSELNKWEVVFGMVIVQLVVIFPMAKLYSRGYQHNLTL